MPEEQNEQDKIHKLDDLNRRLYSRSDKFLGRKKEHPLSKFSYGIQTNWSGSTLRERPKVLKKFTTSYIFKGFFIFIGDRLSTYQVGKHHFCPKLFAYHSEYRISKSSHGR